MAVNTSHESNHAGQAYVVQTRIYNNVNNLEDIPPPFAWEPLRRCGMARITRWTPSRANGPMLPDPTASTWAIPPMNDWPQDGKRTNLPYVHIRRSFSVHSLGVSSLSL